MGVDSAARIVCKPPPTAADFLPIDVEVIVNKIYCYFHIYTVREKRLKAFCEVQSWLQLNHGNAPWLSLMCATERILHHLRPPSHSCCQEWIPLPSSVISPKIKKVNLHLFSSHCKMVVLHVVKQGSSRTGLGVEFRVWPTHPRLWNWQEVQRDKEKGDSSFQRKGFACQFRRWK